MRHSFDAASGDPHEPRSSHGFLRFDGVRPQAGPRRTWPSAGYGSPRRAGSTGSSESAVAGAEGWPWPRRLVQGQRLPPGEALVGAVPEGDLLLAELPAKQDL